LQLIGLDDLSSMLLVSISALVLTIAGIKANAGKPIVTQFAGACEVVLPAA
jgi:hypothetical protein